MVVAIGHGSKLLGEAFATCVVSPGARIVPPPIPEGTGDSGEFIVVRGHAASITQGDVMGGVEGKRGEMAESARCHSS